MSSIELVLRFLWNVTLFVFYAIFVIIIGNFLYGAYVVYVLHGIVEDSGDIVHYKVAAVSLIIMICITFIGRKIFYLSLFPDGYKQKKVVQKKKEFDIYVNKEVK